MPGKKTRTCRPKNFPIPIGDEEDQLVCGVLNELHKKRGKKTKTNSKDWVCDDNEVGAM
jgi:hypothetical protein